MKRLAEIGAVLLGIFSGVETVASAGAVIIVFGEVIHLWDLL